MIRIFKIGGNVIDNPDALEAFLKEFAAVEGKKILVHGGGKESTRLSKRLGIETTMINGRRVTDRATLDVVTMVYAGLVNKRIVSILQSMDCDAIGLCGADGNAIKATRRNPEPVDFGYVGDIATEGINTGFILSLLESGLTPVFCAINHDGAGTLLNCNADSVAGALAEGLARVAQIELIYCFEQKGVLSDIDDPDSVIAEITPTVYDNLKEKGIIGGGMIPKVENAIKAVEKGVAAVIIRGSVNINDSSGTKISG